MPSGNLSDLEFINTYVEPKVLAHKKTISEVYSITSFDFASVETYLATFTHEHELLHEKHYADHREYSISLKLQNNIAIGEIVSGLKKAISSIETAELITGKNTSEF